MRKLIGTLFEVIGWTGWVLCGFGGLGLCLRVLYDVGGVWSAVAGLVLGPVTFAVIPWYALLSLGTWTPLLLCYAGGLVSTSLIGAGAAVKY